MVIHADNAAAPVSSMMVSSNTLRILKALAALVTTRGSLGALAVRGCGHSHKCGVSNAYLCGLSLFLSRVR
jgi:hypothetical protein